MSFMKKVARVAAPFANLIPGAGPFISAGLSVLGNLPGGNKGSGSSVQNPNSQMFNQSITDVRNRSNDLYSQGQPLLQQGGKNLQAPADFYHNIIQGGASSSTALAGPRADLVSGYGRNLSNMAQFGPRSGAMAQGFADRGHQLSRDLAGLRLNNLFGASQGLAGIGGQQLGAGSNLLGNSLSGLNSITGSLLGQQSLDLQRDLAHQQMLGGLGGGIGNLLGVLLGPGGILNGSGGSRSGGGGMGNILGSIFSGGGKGGISIGTGGKG